MALTFTPYLLAFGVATGGADMTNSEDFHAQNYVERTPPMFQCDTPDMSNASEQLKLENAFSTSVRVNLYYDHTPYADTPFAVGSGVVIDPSGIIVTNHHVIDDGRKVKVLISDATGNPDNAVEYEAEVVGADSLADIAVLKINTDADLPCSVFATADSVEVGDTSFVIGNNAVDYFSYSAGTVLRHGAYINKSLLRVTEHDMPVTTGFSGGAVFDENAQISGITGYKDTVHDTQSFSIPVDMATESINRVIQYGHANHGASGMKIRDLPISIAERYDLTHGIIIVDPIDEGMPSAKAGLQQIDVITHINGDKVEDRRDYIAKMSQSYPGDEVNLGVWRLGQTFETSVTLIDRAEFYDIRRAARATQDATAAPPIIKAP